MIIKKKALLAKILTINTRLSKMAATWTDLIVAKQISISVNHEKSPYLNKASLCSIQPSISSKVFSNCIY